MRDRVSKAVAAATMTAATAIATVIMPVTAHAAPDGAGSPDSVTPANVDVAAAANPFKLQNRKSLKLLQPQNGSFTAGTKVVQQSDAGTGVQRWYIINDGSWISLQNYSANPTRNMGIDGASTASGAAAIIAAPGSGYNQDWKVLWTDSTQTWFRLQNRGSGLCLGISGASTANGALAAQFACASPPATNQTWQFLN
ncbi:MULTISPECIES: RICIN domain-containing protein [Micromonospora]|uniref:RICIN domain-containing protein n=1 Tax=Micromonospora antibiotica TaxID=2807623 RepID=A0ABS3VA15_9ACTN|nr:RICIN domain-containing protein [Micromonospora antibiotica]MBO4162362.1 RICIN domain-containing protein [Micromonospora antibiotica]